MTPPSSHQLAEPRRGSRVESRRVYSSAGRRRKARWRASTRAAVAAFFVVAIAVAWIRVGEQGSGAVHRGEHVSDAGKSLHLAWPAEGQAAVAVDGIGKLGVSGTQTPVPIASVAKVMTAYLVLTEHPLEPGEEGFTITITPGDVEEFQQRASSNQSVVLAGRPRRRPGETVHPLDRQLVSPARRTEPDRRLQREIAWTTG